MDGVINIITGISGVANKDGKMCRCKNNWWWRCHDVLRSDVKYTESSVFPAHECLLSVFTQVSEVVVLQAAGQRRRANVV